jgi:hypothetical protein
MTKVLTAALLIIVSCTEQSEQKPVETTVCSIAADPGLFDGRVVTVAAFFESDGFEHSSLADPACAGSIISVSEGPSDESAHNTLSKAVFEGRPGTLDKEIRGTFTGTFRWSPKNAPTRTIELKTAFHVIVRRKSKAAAAGK